tara:strand:- start:9280 stop:10062 length:783 start_codon:yes stop_codon:yes gene_type:complete
VSEPRISIITIVYNRKEDLRKTLENISNQDFLAKELIVIDGESTDGTLEIIEEYSNDIDIFISEKDQGIYDAMNKGVLNASGQWLNFMNAGDCYFNKNILSTIFKENHSSDIDLMIGDTIIDYGDFRKEFKVQSLDSIWKGARFIHQSVFIDRKFQLENLYNIDNKIGGDFEFFYNSIKRNANIKILNKFISIFEAGGVSDKKRISSIYGNMKVVMLDDPSFLKGFFYFNKILVEISKIFMKFFLPNSLVKKLQKNTFKQ